MCVGLDGMGRLGAGGGRRACVQTRIDSMVDWAGEAGGSQKGGGHINMYPYIHTYVYARSKKIHGPEEVVEVGPGVSLAGEALAALLDGAQVLAVDRCEGCVCVCERERGVWMWVWM